MSRIIIISLVVGCLGGATRAKCSILLDGLATTDQAPVLSAVLAGVDSDFGGMPDLEAAVGSPDAILNLVETFDQLAGLPVNDSGKVNRNDVLTVLMHMGQWDAEADFNNDGMVGLLDFAQLVTPVVSAAVPPASIANPEPAALTTWIGLLAFSLGVAIRRRGRG